MFSLVSSVHGEKANRLEKFRGGEKRGSLSNLGNLTVCPHTAIPTCKLKTARPAFNLVCVRNHRVKNQWLQTVAFMDL